MAINDNDVSGGLTVEPSDELSDGLMDCLMD